MASSQHEHERRQVVLQWMTEPKRLQKLDIQGQVTDLLNRLDAVDGLTQDSLLLQQMLAEDVVAYMKGADPIGGALLDMDGWCITLNNETGTIAIPREQIIYVKRPN